MAREFEIIAAVRPLLDGDGSEVPVGTDDDAAIVDVGGRRVAVAVDTLVDERHFDRSLSSLHDIGWKALAVNVSDLVAIGARPVAAVVSLQRTPDFGVDEAVSLYGGLRAAADAMGAALVGGDTVGSPILAVSVTVLGAPVDDERALRRDRARPGDAVVVIGPVGLAAAGLALARAGAVDVLDEYPRLLDAHRRPQPMLAALETLVGLPVSAAIDVSDGLGRDLAHIARDSGVAIVVEERRLPVAPGLGVAGRRLGVSPIGWVVGGGDDYAIAATVAPADVSRLETSLQGVASCAVIGEVVAGEGMVTLETDGQARDISGDGWEHE